MSTDISVGDLQIWSGRQSLNGTLIDPYHYPKLRATIERDAHDNQSHARVEAWTTDQGWQPIHSVPIQTLPIAAYSYSYGAKGETAERYYAGSSLCRRAGLPFWTETMHKDLLSLIEYGKRFFS